MENTPSASAQVLVIEDGTEIRELISLLVLRQGHRVQQCESALEGLEKLKVNQFDLIILDWMMPEMSGIEFLSKAECNGVPVLMVTAKSSPEDIVQGLDAGADDYITKPFEPNVLIARVKALLRRSLNLKHDKPSDLLKFGGLELDLSTYEFRVRGDDVKLTPSEFKIMSEMMGQIGRVLTREHLIEVVQGEGISVTGRTIDTHVFGLRKKLGPEADLIETIRGVGYRIRSE